MKTKAEEMLNARVPVALLKQIDRAAKAADRSRSAEVRRRLASTFPALEKRSAA